MPAEKLRPGMCLIGGTGDAQDLVAGAGILFTPATGLGLCLERLHVTYDHAESLAGDGEPTLLKDLTSAAGLTVMRTCTPQHMDERFPLQGKAEIVRGALLSPDLTLPTFAHEYATVHVVGVRNGSSDLDISGGIYIDPGHMLFVQVPNRALTNDACWFMGVIWDVHP